MKPKLILLALAILTSVAMFAKKQTLTFNVSMDCESCKKKIEKNIAFEKGVKDMKVNLSEKTVEVTFDDEKTTSDKLIAAFKKLGYEAKVVQ
jgi:periplasmic mercuric ion binding protein